MRHPRQPVKEKRINDIAKFTTKSSKFPAQANTDSVGQDNNMNKQFMRVRVMDPTISTFFHPWPMQKVVHTGSHICFYEMNHVDEIPATPWLSSRQAAS